MALLRPVAVAVAWLGCVQMIDEKMEPAAAKEILKGNADALNSAFHLGYNMLLNLLRVEGADPEHIMSLSFYQFQCEQTAPALEASMKEREDARDAIVIEDEDTVTQYHALNTQMERCRTEMRDIINQPKTILPFLQPGRLARIIVRAPLRFSCAIQPLLCLPPRPLDCVDAATGGRRGLGLGRHCELPEEDGHACSSIWHCS